MMKKAIKLQMDELCLLPMYIRGLMIFMSEFSVDCKTESNSLLGAPRVFS